MREPNPPTLDDRKAAILRAVVRDYIETAQPVGSGAVARDGDIDVSAATIRNDMAVLEREGFLIQPHTSAGRIPTDLGYRFFVDGLGGPGKLETGQARQVSAFFAHAQGELEQRLEATSHLFADLTEYAAVVVGGPSDRAVIRSVQIIPLHDRVHMLVVAASDGTIAKRTFEVGAGVTDGDVARAESLLANRMLNSPMLDPGDVELSGDRAVDAVAIAALGAFDEGAGPQHVFVDGAAQVASQFPAVDQVREVLSILEQQLLVVTLLRDVIDRGLSVAIGAETGYGRLAECAVVVAPYVIDGEQAGSVGVLGPTRMDYTQALAAVSVVSDRLGESLSEG